MLLSRHTRRREFIAGLGGVAAWPLAARAQQSGNPVIGFIAVGSPDRFRERISAFRNSLRKAGFIDGRNVSIEFRWAAPGHYDQAPPLAAELVDRRVNVIVATNAAQAAKAATKAIPIVSLFGGDPVESGLVASLNQPGGNLTGIAMFTYSLGGKRFELLREAIPNAKLIAVLVNSSQPDPASRADAKEVEAAARALGQKISILNASSERDFEPAFDAMVREGAGALLVMADPFFYNQHDQLIALASRKAIPAIYEWREFASAGGLMSYGSSITDAYRVLGDYTAQVLKGANPADLPVQRSVKIELVINLKTAKTLGLTFPLAVLARADEVIE
jgi:putative tryptophan/tyrosine transport system substrate-binding protein